MDPISDMLIRVKNAQIAGHETVQIPYSRFKHEIAKTLERGGFIENVDRKGKRTRKFIEVTLKFSKTKDHGIHDVALISKPSRRLYAPYKDILRSRHRGTVIVSTSYGVMSSKEAHKAKIGGEIIAEVW